MSDRLGDSERLRHMIEAIDRIDRFTEDMDLTAFAENEGIQYGVIKNFEIIGEAAYHLSKELKKQYSDMEWRKMEGMRHFLVHEYYRINHELLWNTKEDKLPDLRSKLMDILEAEA